MKENDEVYLSHIVDAIERIEEYCQGVSRQKFLKNKMEFDDSSSEGQYVVDIDEIQNINDEFYTFEDDEEKRSKNYL